MHPTIYVARCLAALRTTSGGKVGAVDGDGNEIAVVVPPSMVNEQILVGVGAYIAGAAIVGAFSLLFNARRDGRGFA